MSHKIHIPDQRPVILDGRKLKMRPVIKHSIIGKTTYVVSSEYDNTGKENALTKMKRVILRDGDSADVTQKQGCDTVDSHTSDCLAEKRKESDE